MRSAPPAPGSSHGPPARLGTVSVQHALLLTGPRNLGLHLGLQRAHRRGPRPAQGTAPRSAFTWRRPPMLSGAPRWRPLAAQPRSPSPRLSTRLLPTRRRRTRRRRLPQRPFRSLPRWGHHLSPTPPWVSARRRPLPPRVVPPLLRGGGAAPPGALHPPGRAISAAAQTILAGQQTILPRSKLSGGFSLSHWPQPCLSPSFPDAGRSLLVARRPPPPPPAYCIAAALAQRGP